MVLENIQIVRWVAGGGGGAQKPKILKESEKLQGPSYIVAKGKTSHLPCVDFNPKLKNRYLKLENNLQFN